MTGKITHRWMIDRKLLIKGIAAGMVLYKVSPQTSQGVAQEAWNLVKQKYIRTSFPSPQPSPSEFEQSFKHMKQRFIKDLLREYADLHTLGELHVQLAVLNVHS